MDFLAVTGCMAIAAVISPDMTKKSLIIRQQSKQPLFDRTCAMRSNQSKNNSALPPVKTEFF